MTERDQDEQDWRIEQMNANIEKLRAETDKIRLDAKAETRRFMVQSAIAAAALLGAGVALARFVIFRQ